MVGKVELASLRKDLHMFAQNVLRSDTSANASDWFSLAERCFAKVVLVQLLHFQDSPLACQREFCRALVKIGTELSGRYDCLPLVLFGGMAEAPNCGRDILIPLFDVFESFLSTCNPDILLESVNILNVYIKERVSSSVDYTISDREVDLLKSACRLLLPHWDSDNDRVLKSVVTFFGHIFNLAFVSRLPEPFTKWVQSEVIENCILEAPFCRIEPVILTKGSIRLIDVLIKQAPLSWVFERSPYLLTSLLIALAWNYSAALAGDVINSLIQFSHSCVNQESVLNPLANFLMHGVISCSAEQQLKYLPRMDCREAAKLRLQNFILRCCKEPLANLPANPDTMLGMTFLHEIVNHLVLLLNMSDLVFDFRLTSFVNLLPLLPLDVAVQVTQENPKLIEAALSHSSDRIRADMCNALSRLVLKTPFDSDLNPELYCWFFAGVKSLLISSDPTARNLANRAFFVAAQHIRNRCATCSAKELDAYPVHRLTGVKGYPPFFVKYPDNPANSWLGALADIYHFASTLWSCHAAQPDISFEISALDLTPFMKELLSRPLIPSGMPYQRQKMLILLIRSVFELSTIENCKKFGFEPCTASNLQLILERMAGLSGFPSLKDRSTWLQLIASLPNANSDVQVSLLEILTTYWPQSTPEWLTSEVRMDLYQLARTWSNFHLPEIYTAGANLFQWLFTTVDDEATANDLASQLLEDIDEGCKASSALQEEGSTEGLEDDRFVRQISEKPIHGFLIAVDNILNYYGKRLNGKMQFPQPVFNDSVDKTVFSRLGGLLHQHLAEACLHLSNECLSVMGVPDSYISYEGASLSYLVAGCEASSFGTLGQSVLGLALQKKTLSENTLGPLDDNSIPIELPSEYKRILSWSWINLKLTSNILVKWVYFRICMALTPGQQFEEIELKFLPHVGKHLIGILMACRHKGLVESVYQSLQDYLTIASYLSQNTSIGALKELLIQPEQVIDVCLLAVKVGKFSVTRRAAGLWPAVKAALMSELIVSPFEQRLFYRWLCEILEIARSSVSSMETADAVKRDPPQALALHLMKGALEDARLGSVVFGLPPPPGADNWLTTLFCDLVLPNFSHEGWTVFNGSLQLFTTIMKRLIGPLHSHPGTSVGEVFGRYPRLFHTFKNILSNFSTENCLARNPAVPLLGLLSRLKPSSNAAFSEENSAEMLECLRPFLSHQVAQIRSLAAKSLIAFFLPSAPRLADASVLASSGGLQIIFKGDLFKSSATVDNSKGANAISGQLLALRAWIRRAPTSFESGERAKIVDWPVAIRLLNAWIGSNCRHWYLAAHLVKLMRCVFMAIPFRDKPHYYLAFRGLCDCCQWKDCPNDIPTEALLPVFHSAFYDLYHTVNEFKPIFTTCDSVFVTSPDTPQHNDLLFHLLSSMECGVFPDLGEIISGKALTPNLLALALDNCRVGCKEEARIIQCLESLINIGVKSTTESITPGILKGIASAIVKLPNIEARGKFVDWWFEHLKSCALIETAREQSRLQASKALLEFLDFIKQSNDIPASHMSSFLELLFCGLFDESAEVRQVFGRAVGRFFDLTYDVCPLKGVDLLISNLQKFTSTPSEWLIDFARRQLQAIVDRARTLYECRLRCASMLDIEIPDDDIWRNVYHEPDSPNPYFDVLCVIGIIFGALGRYSVDKTILKADTASALEQVRGYLNRENDLRSATLILNSASLYQAVLAKRLASTF
ncbi:hypothetical protein Aperf_G00000010541 [Anoplocephala perfoliata]